LGLWPLACPNSLPAGTRFEQNLSAIAYKESQSVARISAAIDTDTHSLPPPAATNRLVSVNSAPADFNPRAELPKGFYDFLLSLHRSLGNLQKTLLERRSAQLNAAERDELPDYLAPSPATTQPWKIDLPLWCQDQRNQMTGPADDAELVIKMLNSGAPGVMLDLEDSVANSWTNIMDGIANIVSALHGELSYFDRKRGRKVEIASSSTVVFTRPRGLHVHQAGIIAGDLISASLFDVAMVAWQVDASRLKHPLCFYIPKSESAEEALWWSAVFAAIENARGWERGWIKCMALVESHPLAYQMEEFAWNLRDHLMGLNLGRWDYMASLIHFNLGDANWVLPDRNTIPHDVPFFQNLRLRMPEICHKHGMLAIGGMTALFPSRENMELNERALTTLAADKKNEARCLMDGAWTGHPDQNQIAVAQFPVPNQISARPANPPAFPELRPTPTGVGARTLAGTRAAVRTVIRYRNGVINGRGASLLDGYMEDLATDRIYRLMIAQRMSHWATAPIIDGTGSEVPHTRQFITRLFNEELARLLGELPADTSDELIERYREARRLSEMMILSGEFALA
jgi:malate synthase